MLSLLKKKGGRVVVMLHLDSLQGQKSMPTTPNPFFLTFGVVEALCLTRISLLEWSRRFVLPAFKENERKEGVEIDNHGSSLLC